MKQKRPTEERIVSRFSELLAIKQRRENRKISKSEVGRETGIPKRSIDRYAANRVTRFDEHILIALCNYFDCELNELLVVEDIEVHEDEDTALSVAV